MANRRNARVTTFALAGLALAAGIVFSPTLARRPGAERGPPPSPAAIEHLRPAVVDPDFSQARPGEVRATLARAFGGAVEPVRDDALVGDFNGDGSPDL